VFPIKFRVIPPTGLQMHVPKSLPDYHHQTIYHPRYIYIYIRYSDRVTNKLQKPNHCSEKQVYKNVRVMNHYHSRMCQLLHLPKRRVQLNDKYLPAKNIEELIRTYYSVPVRQSVFCEIRSRHYRDLSISGMLHTLCWYLVTEVTGKDKSAKIYFSLDCLTLENGTYMLYQTTNM
jgi:hypothetical protein